MPNMLKVIFVVLTVCASVCGCIFNQSLSDDKDVPKDLEMPTFVLRAA